MVLCSDGIYEFMTNDDIVNLVHAQAEQGAQAAQIAQHLVRPSACFLECWSIAICLPWPQCTGRLCRAL